MQFREAYIDALLKETVRRKKYFTGEEVESIYFGGGTPSVLEPAQLQLIMNQVKEMFPVKKSAEITLEANPDDLTGAYLDVLRELSINRLSIGVQSFHKSDLLLLRRVHNEKEAEQSIYRAARHGFTNINIDLIYGIPGLSAGQWKSNLQRAVNLPVTHISAYHLTFEPGTVFDHWRKQGRIIEMSEEESVNQYNSLREELEANGFDHYEVSNFARKGNHSRHNMIYWSNKNYLGLGASAHSFDGTKRSWNVASIKKYIRSINAGEDPGESEILDDRSRYHDVLITTLRTREGLDPHYMTRIFNERITDHFQRVSAAFVDRGILAEHDGRLHIPPERWITADGIIRDLMLEE
jgi:oxygen-independent coproporphyrinogen-3 oxidase